MLPFVNGNPNKLNQTSVASKYPQGYFKEKACKECLTFFTPTAPSNLYCGDYCALVVKNRKMLATHYGITLEEWQSMYDKQRGMCYICRGIGFHMKECESCPLVIDHCHDTGLVRGLLCHNCNRALGLLQDDVSALHRAIEYLEGATTIRKE